MREGPIENQNQIKIEEYRKKMLSLQQDLEQFKPSTEARVREIESSFDDIEKRVHSLARNLTQILETLEEIGYPNDLDKIGEIESPEEVRKELKRHDLLRMAGEIQEAAIFFTKLAKKLSTEKEKITDLKEELIECEKFISIITSQKENRD